MFIEPQNLINQRAKRGWLEVICGSMFSGKTEELMRRIRRVEYASQNIQLFKPEVDKRYVAHQVVSHDQRKLDATVVASSVEIKKKIDPHTHVLAIDEAQFFDEALPSICRELANNGLRIIVTGLDMDYLGAPFGVMPQLLAHAEYVTKLHAICVCCGGIAQYTFRKTSEKKQLLIDTGREYEPRCRVCFNASQKES